VTTRLDDVSAWARRDKRDALGPDLRGAVIIIDEAHDFLA
jgi:hypothetical protein